MTAVPSSPCERLIERLRASRLPPHAERRRIRRAAKASLEDVARELGVDKMTVSRWERGMHEPRAPHLRPYRELLAALEALAQE